VVVKACGETVEKECFIKNLRRPAQACQSRNAVTIETQPEGAPDLALGGLGSLASARSSSANA